MYDRYEINRPVDMKLNVRPVYNAMIHDLAYEGPCRFGEKDELTHEFDAMSAEAGFKRFQERVASMADGNPDINMLPPVLATVTDEFSYKENVFDELGRDIGDVDAFFMQSVSPATSRLLGEMSHRFNKPIVLFAASGTITEGNISHMHHRGYTQIWGAISWKQAAQFLRCLKVKKALENTRVLKLFRYESKNYLTDDTDTDRSFGVEVTNINVHEMFDMMDTNEEGTGNYTLPLRQVANLDAEDDAEAERVADELIADADEVWMERGNIVKSVRFNIMTRKLMQRFNCNAFTGQCKECCATTRINQAQVTWCLGNSLNHEDRIASACEGDMNALRAITVMACLARKAPYMSNTSPIVLDEDGTVLASVWFQPSPVIRQYPNELYCNWHAVPSRKMKFGYDSNRESSCAIGPFTSSERFGATFRYDFSKDKGEVVTFLRFNPEGTKILITRSHILDGTGYERYGCPEGLYYRLTDRDEFFQNQIEFGSHMVMAYGDYVNDLKDFAKIMGLETVIFTDD
jgi:hypothetical protein